MDSLQYVVNLVIHHDLISLDAAYKGEWSHLLFPTGSDLAMDRITKELRCLVLARGRDFFFLQYTLTGCKVHLVPTQQELFSKNDVTWV